jgi:8-oxo-dGTP pyrophosphatase MutT (NUDIX family)
MNSAPHSPPSAPTRPIRFAATLIVLRDGAAGLEVLMLRRAEKEGDQNSGASVFPGGGVDPHDRLLHACCEGPDDATASQRLALPAGGLDFYVAAIRECFEEAGLLFASEAYGRPVAFDALPEAELAALRATTEEGAASLRGLCAERGWRLAVDRLAYFAHWLTPPGMPRRFDTRFFVALAPGRQQARPDGRETVEHFWLRPAEALDPARGLRLMNVQRRVLEQLAAFGSAEECVAHARGLPQIPLVMPRRALAADGLRAVNPDEPAYAEIARIDPEGEGHGRCELDDGLVMTLSPRVLRVTVRRAGLLVNGYLVGGERNEWALIDVDSGDERHRALLLSSAPGPVRWVLSAHGMAMAPGEHIDLGGCGLRVLGQGWLLEEERMLFAAEAPAAPHLAAVEVEWLALRSGFLQRV